MTGPRNIQVYSEADSSWRKMAACKDTDPSLFFPVGTSELALEQIESAKEVCRACDVTEECLIFALETGQDSGIWGGTSEEERRKMKKDIITRRRSQLSS